MKKISFLFLVFLLALPLASYALSIGGADTLGRNKFAVGLDSEYTFDQVYQRRQTTTNFVIVPGVVEIHTANGNQITVNALYRETVKVSYGILKNLDIYVKAGIAKIDDLEYEGSGGINAILGGPPLVASATNGGHLRSNLGLALGAGLKGKIDLPFTGWFIGTDLQYARSRARTKLPLWQTFVIAGVPVGQEIGNRGFVTLEEWQVAPYIAKKLGNFTPYIGGKYSYSRMKLEFDGRMGPNPFGPGTIPMSQQGSNERTGNIFGAFCGLDWNIGKHVTLNLEGRFIDETAVSGTATYKF